LAGIYQLGIKQLQVIALQKLRVDDDDGGGGRGAYKVKFTKSAFTLSSPTNS